MQIVRTFYPVGQGAFYGERIRCDEETRDYNVVYDCGSWKTDVKKSNRIINQAFTEEDIIDILFISHFDFDHVSMISVLKDRVRQIKNVVLPLLYDNEKKIVSELYKGLGFDLSTLINSPQDYFGSDTKIIYIDTESIATSDADNQMEISGISNEQKINSGQPIILNECCDWAYIPYNYEYIDRHEQLVEQLNAAGFDMGQLSSNADYSLNVFGDKRKKLREIYDKLEGRINQNCMIVYSGPSIGKGQHFCKTAMYKGDFMCCNTCLMLFRHVFPTSFNSNVRKKSACLYTGDADFNVSDVQSMYRPVWVNIGTIQIPHHGSSLSFNDKFFSKDEYYCCPISFSTNNSYGHPSAKVLAEIVGSGNLPISVTESLGSTYVEIISIESENK